MQNCSTCWFFAGPVPSTDSPRLTINKLWFISPVHRNVRSNVVSRDSSRIPPWLQGFIDLKTSFKATQRCERRYPDATRAHSPVNPAEISRLDTNKRPAYVSAAIVNYTSCNATALVLTPRTYVSDVELSRWYLLRVHTRRDLANATLVER